MLARGGASSGAHSSIFPKAYDAKILAERDRVVERERSQPGHTSGVYSTGGGGGQGEGGGASERFGAERASEMASGRGGSELEGRRLAGAGAANRPVLPVASSAEKERWVSVY